MTTWTRVTDPDTAVTLLPAWFAARMMATRGCYGFLLATGDILRIARVTAVHVSSDGSILIDVLLDHAGVPGGVDLAWQSKHFLGTPVPGASLATLNLAQLVLAIEFTAAEIANTANDLASPFSDAVPTDTPAITDAVIARDTERVE
ncbi:MAG: hypothetical protein JO299_20500 [Gammaproteobacteria bacterium]|nr:hypothetical protein [Gammaproteobacteria bacterium]